MTGLTSDTIIYKPDVTTFADESLYFLIDGDKPNWIAVDERGKKIFDLIDGKRKLSDIVREYGSVYGFDSAKAWLHVHNFINDAIRCKIISISPISAEEYKGRENYLKASRLNEFWIHTNNSCNLECSHCLFESSPSGDAGMPAENIRNVMDESCRLGVFRFYFTGGEPFVRRDIFDLIKYATEEKGNELIVLTNATLFGNGKRAGLRGLDKNKVKLQVSLDGSTSEINDPIRGRGTCGEITEGLKSASDLGFDTSLATVVTKENINDIPNLPPLAKKLGAKSIHLMWMHRRGRAYKKWSVISDQWSEYFEKIVRGIREVKKVSDEVGIVFDNYESLKLRVNGRPGVKYDMASSCWDTLCLYSDGNLYPSASFGGCPSLRMGSPVNESLKSIWLDSKIARDFRGATVVKKSKLTKDPFRFITGGGDIEQ